MTRYDPSQDSLSVGGRIRIYRKAMGLSQVELTKRLGCSESKIPMIENGKRKPTIDFLYKIANETGCPPWIIDDRYRAGYISFIPSPQPGIHMAHSVIDRRELEKYNLPIFMEVSEWEPDFHSHQIICDNDKIATIVIGHRRCQQSPLPTWDNADGYDSDYCKKIFAWAFGHPYAKERITHKQYEVFFQSHMYGRGDSIVADYAGIKPSTVRTWTFAVRKVMSYLILSHEGHEASRRIIGERMVAQKRPIDNTWLAKNTENSP